jgi:hypothetical protein
MYYKHETFRRKGKIWIRALAYFRKKLVATSPPVEFVDINSAYQAESLLAEAVKSASNFSPARLEARAETKIDGEQNELVRKLLADTAAKPKTSIRNEQVVIRRRTR